LTSYALKVDAWDDSPAAEKNRRKFAAYVDSEMQPYYAAVRKHYDDTGEGLTIREWRESQKETGE